MNRPIQVFDDVDKRAQMHEEINSFRFLRAALIKRAYLDSACAASGGGEHIKRVSFLIYFHFIMVQSISAQFKFHKQTAVK